MKARRTQRIEQAAIYFDEGLWAIYQKWRTGEITEIQMEEKLNEHSGYAQDLCRKQIIQAFDMGFKLGVFWHIEMTENKSNNTPSRSHGIEYYENIYEAE